MAVLLATALLNATTAVAVAGVGVSGCADAGPSDGAHMSMAAPSLDPGDPAIGPGASADQISPESCCDVDAACTANGHCAPMFAIAAAPEIERAIPASTLVEADSKFFLGLKSRPTLPPPILR